MTQPGKVRLEVDPAVSAHDSVVRRYSPGLLAEELSPEDVALASQREGMRLLELPPYRGVRLFVLDETTRMRTGTYKSLDGCLSTALCRRWGLTQAVFSSGANAGVVLTDYAARTNLDTYFFCPASTLHKLDGALFDRPGRHLFGVRGSDRLVKESARRFAQALDLPVIPRLDWRMLSAACRALFLVEQMQTRGLRFSWFSQSVCAAYGPIGVYKTFQDLAESGQLEAGSIPKFLGIQQAGLSPIVSAWLERRTTLPAAITTAWSETPIEPTLYNVHPAQTYPLVHDLLKQWGGDMMALGAMDFQHWSGAYVGMLEEAGIRLTRVSRNGQWVLLENAGVLAGAATLKSIADGRIQPGETVLCGLTGGAGPAPSRPARPEFWIDCEASLDALFAQYVGCAVSEVRVSA